MLDLLVADGSGEFPLLVRSRQLEVCGGCVSGSGEVAVDDRRDDPMEEVGRGILDAVGLASARFTNTGDTLLSPPTVATAAEACELGDMGLLGVDDLEAAVEGVARRLIKGNHTRDTAHSLSPSNLYAAMYVRTYVQTTQTEYTYVHDMIYGRGSLSRFVELKWGNL